jgi:hypothetical protein
MNTENTYQTNWSKIDLSNGYQRNLNLLENYTFDTLLLEVACNIKDSEINKETVKAQALESINAKYIEALEILNDNLDNLTSEAIKEANNH